jgi:arylsulfatase A-like enzyme
MGRSRREFLQTAALGAAAGLLGQGCAAVPPPAGPSARPPSDRPSLLFVFADQWRAQATGYSGNRQVRTPNLDRLAAGSVNFATAVSGCPVCSPYRASLMTGQYPQTHGVFLNDAPLRSRDPCLAQVLAAAGYDTAYIGKWHLDGPRRSAYIPPERRLGFDFWRGAGCIHDYHHSFYMASPTQRVTWQGYDALAQTREAQDYLRSRTAGRPFALFLSFGPPHPPYGAAPARYRALFRAAALRPRKNVPGPTAAAARRALAGYYAHIAALDHCLGALLQTLERQGLARRTIVVFTADHGDMLYSQGQQKKQQPWDEALRVPFLLRLPGRGVGGRTVHAPIDAPDVMPTLLGLCGLRIPASVQGRDLSGLALGAGEPEDGAALIACVSPFGAWSHRRGGREYRGLRTRRHTYVRDLSGPWLLYDNERDPLQLENLCGRPEQARLQARLEQQLSDRLARIGDAFDPGETYLRRWGYRVDEHGAIPYQS